MSSDSYSAEKGHQTEVNTWDQLNHGLVHDPSVKEADVKSVKLGKQFSLWSTLGISYSITSTPLAIGTYLSVEIGVGGSPVFFFGFLLVFVLNMCICFSLAEMAAVYPHSAG